MSYFLNCVEDLFKYPYLQSQEDKCMIEVLSCIKFVFISISSFSSHYNFARLIKNEEISNVTKDLNWIQFLLIAMKMQKCMIQFLSQFSLYPVRKLENMLFFGNFYLNKFVMTYNDLFKGITKTTVNFMTTQDSNARCA